MYLRDCVDDQGFERVGPLEQVSIDVQVDKTIMDSGAVEMLAEWIAAVPSAKECREKKIGVEELTRKVEDALLKISEKHGKDDGEKSLAIRKSLVKFGPYFRRVDCDRLGLCLIVEHPNDGGPVQSQVGPLLKRVKSILGEDRVSQNVIVEKAKMRELDELCESRARYEDFMGRVNGRLP